MNESSHISLREAAERLGVHYMTAYKYVRTGRLLASKNGDEWLVRVADVDDIKPGRRTTEPGVRGKPRRQQDTRPRLEERLTAGDESGAWAVIEASMNAGATAEEVYLDLLGPALESIGDRWAAGTLDITEEHRATAVAFRVVGRMGPRFRRPGLTKGSIVVGAAAGDDHALPSALLADILRGANYFVADLGANTPAASFVTASKTTPKLLAVGICASTSQAVPAIRAAVKALRKSGWEGAIVAGGKSVEDRAAALSLGASHWEPDTSGLLRVLDEIRADRLGSRWPA